MTDKTPDNPPAFPLPDGTEYVREYHPGHGDASRIVRVAKPGMTLRDYFAAKAMQACRSRSSSYPSWQALATDAYEIADAMLAARNQAPA